MADQGAQPNNSINASLADYIESMSLNQEGLLRSINLTLKQIARGDGLLISQSSLKDLADAEKQMQQQIERDRRGGTAYDKSQRNTGKSSATSSDFEKGFSQGASRQAEKRGKSFVDSMTDDMEKAFTETFFGSSKIFDTAIKKSASAFAESLGTNLNGLGAEIGKRLATKALDTKLGDRLQREFKWAEEKAAKAVNKSLSGLSEWLGGTGNIDLGDLFSNKDTTNEKAAPTVGDLDNDFAGVYEGFDKVVEAIKNSKQAAESNGSGLNDILDATVTEDADGALHAVVESASSSSTALTQLAPAATKTLPALTEMGGAASSAASGAISAAAAFPLAGVAILAAVVVIDKLSEAVGPAVEGFKSFASGISSAANRVQTQNSKNTELWKKRVEQDITSITEVAYDIVKDSAKQIESIWDSVSGTVAAAQGYDKAGVQDLWSSYAQRLKNEGLSSVVSSADIMEQLQSVLKSGLSGAVAEEFAYQATLLGNAIPTEDFFSYAETYASLAANAMKNGLDQEEAIKYANRELSLFASNILYASREIAGGFTTSLTNASSLFEQSAKVAVTGRNLSNLSEISGVMTSVSAIIGATAPDLADSIVNAVVDAATGGNASNLTALRSMAGVGASNTAFLQALARNPQQVFESLFRNLSQLQNMSSANYMEVAEALSSVFGVSMDAFARVDFGYLADAISNMNVSTEALEQNLNLLMSGETTSTEAQMRMQKINEYMIDEGLAYVLDNEAARAIQEHMWEEQLAREIEQNTFSVQVVGGLLDLMNGIATTVQNIANILNPAAWFKKIDAIALTLQESAAQSDEIAQIVERGKVGAGNQTAFTNLTSGGKDLNLTRRYVELLGGVSTVAVTREGLAELATTYSKTSGLLGKIADKAANWLTGSDDIYSESTRSDRNNVSGSSGITGKITGKSQATAASAGTMAATSRYTRTLVSKTVASALSSGDWRTDAGYSAIWDNYQTSRTLAESAKRMSGADMTKALTDSISAYVTSNAATATSLDNLRKETETEYGTQLHRGYYSQAEIMSQVVNEALTSSQGGTFEQWKTEFEKSIGNQNLDAVLADYGTDIEAIRAAFEQQEAAQSNAATKARNLHEVQFWEDMQQFATIDFPWYMREWERYYIQHEAYTNATGEAYKQALDLAAKEKGETGDSVLALAEALVQNNNWVETLGDAIKDPQVQTNTLLAKILLTVEAIMQQNNETSIVSVPTSLASLGLGFSNK